MTLRKIKVLWYVFICKNFCGKKGNTFEITFPIPIRSNTFKCEYEPYIFPMSVQGVPIEKYINKRKTPCW